LRHSAAIQSFSSGTRLENLQRHTKPFRRRVALAEAHSKAFLSAGRGTIPASRLRFQQLKNLIFFTVLLADTAGEV
jgi:hypothetical protein